MTLKAPQETVVRTPTDLYRLWQDLMGDGGFGRRSVWLLFLSADGRPEPVIVPIDDIPARPNARLVDALGSIVRDLVHTGEVDSVALLLSRPGRSDMCEDDRGWARALVAVSRRWPIHLATEDHLQVFAPDDLLPTQRPPDAA
jgi:hypothetical protein